MKLDLRVLVLRDLLPQVSIVSVLHDEVEFVSSHLVGDQLDDVWVIKLLQNFYLAENLSFSARVFDSDLLEREELS